jgi:hypothetical protein
MKVAGIVQCIGVVVFAASLHAGAQPPDGKGKPAHAGPSPFIRFPVPQHAVGVLRHPQAEAAAVQRVPGVAAKGFSEAPSAKLHEVRAERESGVGNAKPAKSAEIELWTASGGVPAAERKAPLPECGAR